MQLGFQVEPVQVVEQGLGRAGVRTGHGHGLAFEGRIDQEFGISQSQAGVLTHSRDDGNRQRTRVPRDDLDLGHGPSG